MAADALSVADELFEEAAASEGSVEAVDEVERDESIVLNAVEGSEEATAVDEADEEVEDADAAAALEDVEQLGSE